MAGLPQTTANSSLSESQDRFYEAIAEQIAAGRRPADIARRVYPHDRNARGKLRRRIWRMVREDDEFLRRMNQRARGEMVLGIVPQARRLATSRRVDAIKLLFEASGFHNPRVQHEHSGDIDIRLTIPRPDREPKAIDVPEADVVED